MAVPLLSQQKGFYYVIEARAGAISSVWQVSGAGVVEMFLLRGAPYGLGTGMSDVVQGEIAAQSQVSTGKVSITQASWPAGTYTLFFQSSGLAAVSTSSALVTYIPAAVPTATSVAGATPTPTVPTVPTVPGVPPTPTPTPQSAGPTATATPTPVIPATPTPTMTPAPPTQTMTPYP
ncbi:MAG: hypothetical protein HY675_18445 [Chloroflexi bacterium]|nr:hypothetical protein [Chloroflexota bacterium]